jgi:hypothetical protein
MPNINKVIVISLREFIYKKKFDVQWMVSEKIASGVCFHLMLNNQGFGKVASIRFKPDSIPTGRQLTSGKCKAFIKRILNFPVKNCLARGICDP